MRRSEGGTTCATQLNTRHASIRLHGRPSLIKLVPLMSFVRRHLRSLTTAWIVFQATSLSALVPRACCLAHQAAVAVNAPECHEQAVPPNSSMTSDAGPAASMHHMHGSAHHQASPPDQKPAPDCAIRGMCGGPLAALAAIFSTQGVLTESFTSLPDSEPRDAAVAVADQLIRLFVPPDSPPPRS